MTNDNAWMADARAEDDRIRESSREFAANLVAEAERPTASSIDGMPRSLQHAISTDIGRPTPPDPTNPNHNSWVRDADNSTAGALRRLIGEIGYDATINGEADPDVDLNDSDAMIDYVRRIAAERQ